MSSEPGGEERERSAGFVLAANRNGRREFLVLKHRHGGHWAFPKGRIEDGEDELGAARRETMEETGIGDLSPVPDFRVEISYRFVRDGRPVSKRVSYFLAEVDGDEVRLSAEHKEACWLDHDEASARLTYEESRRVLDRAAARLGGRAAKERP